MTLESKTVRISLKVTALDAKYTNLTSIKEKSDSFVLKTNVLNKLTLLLDSPVCLIYFSFKPEASHYEERKTQIN